MTASIFSLSPEPEGKVCKDCGARKLVDQYYKSSKDGKPHSKCKVCWLKMTANNKRRYAKLYPERMAKQLRRGNLRRHYGLTLDQYDAMLAAQNAQCAICGSTQAGGQGRFHVDHDHKTKKLRGLLCSRCNVGLGNFRDDVGNLSKAAAYLHAHRGS